MRYKNIPVSQVTGYTTELVRGAIILAILTFLLGISMGYLIRMYL